MGGKPTAARKTTKLVMSRCQPVRYCRIYGRLKYNSVRRQTGIPLLEPSEFVLVQLQQAYGSCSLPCDSQRDHIRLNLLPCVSGHG